MNQVINIDDLHSMLAFYRTGATRPISYRKEQLKKLKQALTKYETRIADALFTDLKKSPEEAYGTETGLVHSEISNTLRNLHKWLDSKDAATGRGMHSSCRNTLYRGEVQVYSRLECR